MGWTWRNSVYTAATFGWLSKCSPSFPQARYLACNSSGGGKKLYQFIICHFAGLHPRNKCRSSIPANHEGLSWFLQGQEIDTFCSQIRQAYIQCGRTIRRTDRVLEQGFSHINVGPVSGTHDCSLQKRVSKTWWWEDTLHCNLFHFNSILLFDFGKAFLHVCFLYIAYVLQFVPLGFLFGIRLRHLLPVPWMRWWSFCIMVMFGCRG